ncbi:MAG: DUF1538 family protein [Parvibaculum sp.]|nr:DUF1538 family protein [Parvibaculum sp.]MCW5726056.1 DUF1538 family protein [Parvibaculum sp.]
MMEDVAMRLMAAAVDVAIDLAAIAAVMGLFFGLVLRRAPMGAGPLLLGGFYLLAGLVLLRTGLEIALVPLGFEMAVALTGTGGDGSGVALVRLLLFVGLIGFATALIEPALTAMAERTEAVSGGAIRARPFRAVVAAGVGAGLALGAARIHAGIAFEEFLAVMVAAIAALSWGAPKTIRPIAYDSGAVATSLAVVPLVAALGIGIAGALPGRSPLADGFGMVTGALLLPVIAVLLYARLQLWRAAHAQGGGKADAVQVDTGAGDR